MKKEILKTFRRIIGINGLRKQISFNLYEMRRFQLIEHILNDHQSGISTERYADHDIIVSLTTYGKRINDVAFTIESIMQQTMKANKIVLWLDHSFEHQRLPESLLRQRDRGLEIAFCKDIRSYTKLVPALKRYPEAAIITVDDDLLYDYDLLERLILSYLEDPQYIYCHRYHKMTFDKDYALSPYKQWDWQCMDKDASHLNFATGVGGVLYPPHSLDDETTNEQVFLDICKYADDVWFKAMAIKKGTLVKLVSSRNSRGEDYILNLNVQDMCLGNINVIGGQNDLQIKAVFDKYNLYNHLR
jgi:hypothetical protein